MAIDTDALATIEAQADQIRRLQAELSKFVRDGSAYAMGATLKRAVDRARDLHPWQDRLHSLDALWSEVRELAHEIERAQVGADAEVAHRIRAEALDCAVVAWRILEGR